MHDDDTARQRLRVIRGEGNVPPADLAVRRANFIRQLRQELISDGYLACDVNPLSAGALCELVIESRQRRRRELSSLMQEAPRVVL